MDEELRVRREAVLTQHMEGEEAVHEFWLRGTHSGGPRPTGRSFEARLAAVFDFEGDRIVCERVYWDRQTVTKQLRGK